MGAEPILIVDDTPVNLKLTRILLVNEGYKVLTAATAEEALELLRSYHPQLILADIQLPGMDGLEMTRRIKKNAGTCDITVVALTAFAMKGDEQKAIAAGCDGYITKPIDTRTLGARIREYLDSRVEPQEAPASSMSVAPAEGQTALPPAEMKALRRRFLAEGQERVRELLVDLDGHFNAGDAAKVVHQWVGTGGLLGYTAIGRLAREVEAVLMEKPVDVAQLRESVTNLVLAFTSPREARDAPVPDTIIQTLSGKGVAMAGLPAQEAQRLSVALERAMARPMLFEIAETPDVQAMQACDLVVVYVGPETAESPWLTQAASIAGNRPVVFVGNRENLLALEQAVQAVACEFLMDTWQPEEALVRLSLAISHHQPAAAAHQQAAASQPSSIMAPRAPLPRPGGRQRVLVADDDPTVVALVRTALQNFGMDCETATDGPSALEAMQRLRPNAAVLDVNMPGMDGYEVLAAIRAAEIPTRVLLLTARQQESDVIRGFTLGADDYVVKPFSPMELVARLKRLLGR